MTRIATLKLGVPVLRYEAQVRHSTPRVPTAFEATVIDIVHRFSDHMEYRNWSLETVFVDLLCVPDPRPLLTATLHELIDIRILDRAFPFQDSSKVSIGGLSLTERGATVVRTGKLLGRPQEQSIPFVQDAIGGQILSEPQWTRCAVAPPPLAIPAKPFLAGFPEQTFLDHLKLAKPGWYRAGETEIEATWCNDEPVVGWNTVNLSVTLDQAQLVFACERADVVEYLLNAADPDLRRALVNAAFPAIDENTARWPLGSADDAATATPAPALLGTLTNEALLIARVPVMGVIADSLQIPPRHVRVLFSEDAPQSDPAAWRICWNPSRDGCCITVAEALNATGADLITPKRAWGLRRIRVRALGEEFTVPVALQVVANVAEITDNLASRLLATGEPQAMAAALLLQPTAQTLSGLTSALSHRISSRALLMQLGEWEATVERLTGDVLDRVRERWLLDGIAVALSSSTMPIGVDAVEEWCMAIKRLKLKEPSKSVDMLLQHIAPICDIKSLQHLTKCVRTCAKNYSLPYLPSLYQPGVVRQALMIRSESELAAVLLNDNWFETTMRDLWEHGTQVAKRMGAGFPFVAPSDEAVRKLARNRALAQLREAATTWIDEAKSFMGSDTVKDCAADTTMQTAIAHVETWFHKLDAFIESSGADFEHVFVVDTNALIDCPALPILLRKNQLLVLPTTVIDELDKKKTDPALAERCATAVKNLHGMDASHIRFENGDLSRLPDDYRKSPDNRILSVAAKYAGPTLRLVTGDQNLSLKAQAMNMIAVGVDRFLDRPAQHRRTSRPPVVPRHIHSDQKKRTGT